MSEDMWTTGVILTGYGVLLVVLVALNKAPP